MENIGLEAVFKDAGFNQGINKYNGSVDTANKKTSGLANTVKTAAGKIPGLGSAMSLLTNPITLVTAGLGALIGVTVKSVNEVVSYTKTIREMTQVTGLGSEEISRIVQVGDDWGVSAGDIRTALQMMNKKGITPSIDNLAILADEYVDSTDKSKFMEAATKKYGRSVATLIPLLAEGGDSLREQTAAIDDNLIATKEQIDASRKYEVAADDLGDAWTGFTHIIGNAVIPALTDLLVAVKDNIDINQDQVDKHEKLKAAYDAGYISITEYKDAMLSVSKYTDDYIPILDKATAATKANEIAMDDGRQEAVKLSGELYTLTDTTEDVTDATAKFSIEALAAGQAADTEKQALSDMEWVISQPLTTAVVEFNTKQGELQTEMQKVQGEIDILNGKSYLTPEQKTELADLLIKQGELQTEYQDNATEHEAATARILFDLAVEKLGIAGLLTSGVFEDMADAWGLSEDAEINAMIAADEAVNWLRDHPGDVEGMKKILEGQATAWGLTHSEAVQAKDAASAFRDVINSLKDKTIYIRAIYDIIGDPSPPKAEGGPVSAGQSYIVGERGMEMFVPSTNGMIIPNNALSNYSVSTNNNRNVNVNIGGVSIHNGADHQAFISQVEWAVQRALGV